jgi:DNA-binding beta-propeller fold protein YncE
VVFVVDTNRDQLLWIDAATLRIRAVKVGDGPVLVKAFPGTDSALVLNQGSQTASLIDIVDGRAEVRHFDVLPGVNTVAMSPYGPYAVLYYQWAPGGTTLGTLNAVNVLRAETGKQSMIEVGTGFKPSAVAFRQDGGALYVTSQAGLTRVDLPGDVDAPKFRAPLPLVDDPLLDQYEREVLVTADGAYALTRVIGQPVVSVLDLASHAVRSFSSADGSIPSDLDLVPGRASFLLMLRDSRRVQLIDTAGLLAGDTGSVREVGTGDVPLGLADVAADGSRALLYTTAAGVKTVGVLDLKVDPLELSFLPLAKTVRSAVIEPRSEFGVLYHDRAPGALSPNDTLEEQVAKSDGYSVIDLASGYVQPFLTDHEPKDLVFLPEQQKMIVLVPDPSNLDHRVHVVDFTTMLPSSLPLYARPLSVQAFKDQPTAVILEEHLSGRLTILDTDTKGTESVTGFHLNAEE